MMMVSIFGLLILFGGGATVLGLIVYAIACKKFWIIPAAGAIVFLGLMACGLFVARIQVDSPTQVIDGVNPISHTATYGLPHVNSYPVGNSTLFVSGANWSKILIVAILIAFVIGRIIRKGASPAFAHGLRRAWPVVAVVLFVGVMFVLRSTNESYDRARATARTARDAAEAMAARAQILATRQQTLAQETAEKIRNQPKIVPQDIQAEMDQFDAPRILLSPDTTSPRPPVAPTPAATPPAPIQPTTVAETNSKPAEKTNGGEASNTAATTTNKRKKPDKKSATDDTKHAQLTAKTKAAAEATAKKENTTTADKPAMVAEAEPDKPTARPAWSYESPKRTGNTRREVIASGPYATVDECYQSADVYLLLKTYERLQQLAGRSYAEGLLPSLTFRNGAILADGKLMSYGRTNHYWDELDPRLRQLSEMGIGADYLRREIVAKDPKNNESREFVDTVESTVGPMKTLYLQIEFTSGVDRELLRYWDARQRHERFAMVGVGAGSILGLLGCVFALLKIDTATKGYYTKRLFLGVPLAIIVGIVLLIMIGSNPAIYR